MKEIESNEDGEHVTGSDAAVDLPVDLRPDLSALGIEETERGVCEDTYENRQILRNNQLNWDPVFSPQGGATGLISARSQDMNRQRRVLSLQEKKPLLEDPKDLNSEYLTGLDLIIDEDASKIAPPWVVGMTRKWYAEQEAGGPDSPNRAPIAKPHRCRVTKNDGLRCMLWASGRPKDDGLCRMHLKTQRKPGEDIERARRKLVQAAPYAVDKLEQLMEEAESEPVKLKAATEILDRSGLRAGVDVNLDVEVTDNRNPADIVQERLAKLASGAKRTEEALAALGQPRDDGEVIDAEVVENLEEDRPAAQEIFTPKQEEETTTAASDGVTDDELEDL